MEEKMIEKREHPRARTEKLCLLKYKNCPRRSFLQSVFVSRHGLTTLPVGRTLLYFLFRKTNKILITISFLHLRGSFAAAAE